MDKIVYKKEIRSLLPVGSHLSKDAFNELQLIIREHISKALKNAYDRTLKEKRRRIDPIDIHFGYWEAAKNEKALEFIKSIEERFKRYFLESLTEIKSKTAPTISTIGRGD